MSIIDWYETSADKLVGELRRAKAAPEGASFQLLEGESVWEAFVRVWQGVNGENSPWLENYVCCRCLRQVVALPPLRLGELCGRERVLHVLGGPAHAVMLRDASERLWEAVYVRAEHEHLPEKRFDPFVEGGPRRP